jgi:hypothetical protein
MAILADAAGILVELLEQGVGVLDLVRGLFGQPGQAFRALGDLAGRRRDLLDARAHLGGAFRYLLGLVPGLARVALDIRDDALQAGDQRVVRVEDPAELVVLLLGQVHTHVAPGNGLDAAHQLGCLPLVVVQLGLDLVFLFLEGGDVLDQARHPR